MTTLSDDAHADDERLAAERRDRRLLFTAGRKAKPGEITLEEALLAGPNVNHVGKDGYTPLVVAAKNGMVEHVARLLDAGAVVNLSSAHMNQGWTALHHAVFAMHEATVKVLLAAGADPTLPVHPQRHTDPSLLGQNALHLAVSSKTAMVHGSGRYARAMDVDAKVVSLLVEAGCDPLALDGQGRTPLDLWQRSQHQNRHFPSFPVCLEACTLKATVDILSEGIPKVLPSRAPRARL